MGFDAAKPIALPFVVKPLGVLIVVDTELVVMNMWCAVWLVWLQANSAMTSMSANVCRGGINKGEDAIFNRSSPQMEHTFMIMLR